MSNLDTADSGDDSLTYAPGVEKTRTLEFIPPKGSVLHIVRATPVFMDPVKFLV